MKALVQRVKYAKVTINGEEIRETGPGLLVLFGCAVGDDLNDCRKLAEKTANLRIFEDTEGKMKREKRRAGVEKKDQRTG